MGCGIHALLQEQRDDGGWMTIIPDALQIFMSTENREFNRLLSECSSITHGLPEEIQKLVDAAELRRDQGIDDPNDLYLGEHSFYHCTLEDFMDLPSESPQGFSVDHGEDGGFTISVPGVYLNISIIIQSLKDGYRYTFYDLSKYRLVIGFDS